MPLDAVGRQHPESRATGLEVLIQWVVLFGVFLGLTLSSITRMPPDKGSQLNPRDVSHAVQ